MREEEKEKRDTTQQDKESTDYRMIQKKRQIHWIDLTGRIGSFNITRNDKKSIA